MWNLTKSFPNQLQSISKNISKKIPRYIKFRNFKMRLKTTNAECSISYNHVFRFIN